MNAPLLEGGMIMHIDRFMMGRTPAIFRVNFSKSKGLRDWHFIRTYWPSWGIVEGVKEEEG